MQVIETTTNKLVATERHNASRFIAIGLAALIVAAGIYQASIGNIVSGLIIGALAIASSVGICRVLGPVRAVFDRSSDTLSIERQCFYGARKEQHPLSEVRSVSIADRETDDRIPQHVVAIKTDTVVPLTGPYSNSATHENVVQDINAWLNPEIGKS